MLLFKHASNNKDKICHGSGQNTAGNISDGDTYGSVGNVWQIPIIASSKSTVMSQLFSINYLK